MAYPRVLSEPLPAAFFAGEEKEELCHLHHWRAIAMVAQSHVSLLIELVNSAHNIEVLQSAKVAINDAYND